MQNNEYLFFNNDSEPYDKLILAIIEQGIKDLFYLAQTYEYYRLYNTTEDFWIYRGKKRHGMKTEIGRNNFIKHEIDDIMNIKDFMIVELEKDDELICETMKWIKKQYPTFYKDWGDYIACCFNR